MNKSIREYKEKIVSAGERAVEQLIKVANEDINLRTESGSDVDANEIKNAAQSKKMAIFDALEILEKIELVQDELDEEQEIENGPKRKKGNNGGGGFAEDRARPSSTVQ